MLYIGRRKLQANGNRALCVFSIFLFTLGYLSTSFADHRHKRSRGYSTSDCDVLLKQSDFDSGTYIIKNPGKYCLRENISFNPNNAAFLRKKLGDPNITAYESSFPLRSQLGFGPGQYDPSAFGLGFFAAIAVAAPNVTIDLSGKKIEQSKEHALMQRFFSVIETADRPFIRGQGPFDFGTIVGAAENLTIQNGVIGRSAHHGIHGNRTKNLTVKNVNFEDFEVGAIAMNGVEGMTLTNLRATSRKDVPILGQYSTAQFIKPYVDFLVAAKSQVKINGKSAKRIQRALKSAINNVHQDLILRKLSKIDRKAHRKEWNIFHNEAGVVDGNAYGILVNGVGVAVNGFPLTTSTDSPSRNIRITDVKIFDVFANVREIVSLSAGDTSSKAVNDPVGSLFQIYATNPRGRPIALTELSPNGSYKGNVVTDAQALVAKAIHYNQEMPSFLDISRNSISLPLIQWVESGKPLKRYLEANPGPHGTGFICNGDQMFHVNKGVIGLKLDGAVDVEIKSTRVFGITNKGAKGSELCGDYSISHPAATLPGYGGAIVRGISVAGSKDISFDHIRLYKIKSHNGSAIGVDIMTDSRRVHLNDVVMENLKASSTKQSLPMADQAAIGMRFGADTREVSGLRLWSQDLSAFQDATECILDESGQASYVRRCHLSN